MVVLTWSSSAISVAAAIVIIIVERTKKGRRGSSQPLLPEDPKHDRSPVQLIALQYSTRHTPTGLSAHFQHTSQHSTLAREVRVERVGHVARSPERVVASAGTHSRWRMPGKAEAERGGEAQWTNRPVRLPSAGCLKGQYVTFSTRLCRVRSRGCAAPRSALCRDSIISVFPKLIACKYYRREISARLSPFLSRWAALGRLETVCDGDVFVICVF